jgi:hypothetical protein
VLSKSQEAACTCTQNLCTGPTMVMQRQFSTCGSCACVWLCCACRVAKLLLFATLVPETVPVLPSDGTAAYVRRLWRHPVTGMPCEVRPTQTLSVQSQASSNALVQPDDVCKPAQGRLQDMAQYSTAGLQAD